ncbi:hypothetical protein PPSIR1_06131 [Plesiocystis pacifica SIR-1]|uniref:Uncharacterized protein n=1 Tax=Plesiocystis pacifica SIR-1 TaxID=391625 RepID=A6G6V1_9BACT|nr:hypothetical protein PPSIR1_06131 [Plesiocystis pacifica SIR-1]
MRVVAQDREEDMALRLGESRDELKGRH